MCITFGIVEEAGIGSESWCVHAVADHQARVQELVVTESSLLGRLPALVPMLLR